MNYSKTVTRTLAVLVLAFLLVGIGCTKTTAPTPTPTPTRTPTPTTTLSPTPATPVPTTAPAATTTPPASPAPAPGLKITAPAAGATLAPGSVQVSVEVTNFSLVAPGGAVAPGQGHLHYYLDVEIPTTAGQPATSAPGTYKATPGTSATWENIAAGSHTFGVQLVNNNHTPLSPPVTARVTVTVAAPATPGVKITAPAAGATLTPGNVQVSVEATNFSLVAPGGAVAPGQGHLHYYLDVEIPTAAGQPAVSAPGTYKATPGTSATWENVAVGSHTFGVQLVNNNHTPLSPPVTSRVTVTAAAPATPAVKITAPAAGATLATGSVQVSVEATNFSLVAPGGAVAPGQGHLHYYLDVEIPTAAGQPAVSAAGTYKATPGTSATWENVAAGSHTFGVQLVNNNHTPLNPPVTARVTVTVAAASNSSTVPAVKIVSPADGTSTATGSIPVTVQVSNFELVPPGTANAAGKGHLHYYLDVEIPTAAGQPAVTAAGTYKAAPGTSVTWDNVAAGMHTFGVQLVNSDHTPLTPPVTAKATVTVTSGVIPGY